MRAGSVVMSMLVVLAAVSGCGGGDDTAFEPSVVVKWNQVALDAVRNSPPRPTVNSRALFLLHTSMYDAWAAYSPVATGTQLGSQLRRPSSEHTEDNKRAAVSYAAYATLRNLFAAYEQQTGAFAASTTSSASSSPGRTR